MSWLVKDLTPHVQAVGTKLLYVSIQILSAVAGRLNIYMYKIQREGGNLKYWMIAAFRVNFKV